ncbi:bifunctional 4-hydroxy-2-oxoglutarate aldolase/2-dehydro-3-deoxy-phosphogluconate aldolase [Desulfoluna spongiiphila]|uniref:bifunctional 4-hydroxy-2-oxoglutarate aldolase/2-dehydro-3-deoxy-phosphogluconate aldolase n=1 Tax=Desulfoluna spongiiphila TaxID=419481 RepID=UPI00125B5210|nr:bifunctional 4-hydroxy-2-oxoglutarate aldolase/2-dehydro-3-deoxy-phosphogluconate aldolase [Desulfoluna spongiiphila]VVS93174.1 aldolase-type tim barrel [Desulfoluna spongiiphila]
MTGKKEEIIKKVEAIGLVPVIRTRTQEDAVEAVGALVEAGVPVAEVTFSVPDAPGVIARLKKIHGKDCLVGAGTVTTCEECRQALEAGSDFIVTPVTVPEIIELCRARGVAMVCGALTPTEVFNAWSAGADVVKIFPATAMGGPTYIKNLSGPLSQVPVAPTGGVTPDNTEAYLRNGARFVGAGSDLVPAIVDEAAKAQIATQARRYLDAIKAARV